MIAAIVDLRFPLGALPVKGFRCPICGDEKLNPEDVGAAQQLAHKLGLFGLQNAQTRKLLRTGTSIAVTLDPQLLRDVFGSAKAGRLVRVGREGDRIVIVAA